MYYSVICYIVALLRGSNAIKIEEKLNVFQTNKMTVGKFHASDIKMPSELDCKHNIMTRELCFNNGMKL